MEIETTQVKQLLEEIRSTVADLDIEQLKSKAGEFETETLQEDFWNNPERAKNIMKELDLLRKEISTAEKLLEDIETLYEIWKETPSEDRDPLMEYYTRIYNQFIEFQTYKYLSGPYDNNNAILSIFAGQGGTDAQDWAEMLLRMYRMYADKKDFQVNVIHISKGSEAGITSATITISGEFAYGLLKNETGTHRLVRLSPFNAKNLRQTSFARIEVIPEIEDNIEIEIPETDIEFKAVRASGPGGQFVNKTSSAVQIKHIPTGITVHCSERRSQAQNRETAMKILKAKLWHIEEIKKREKIEHLKGEYKPASWGNQIRNYVLHPYKLVKDLRTGVETSDVNSVLDGNLEIFIAEEIKLNQQNENME